MKHQYLETGEIVSTHGIKGEVKVLPWADDPEFLLLLDEIYLDGKAYAVERARVQKTCVLLKLEGIDTVEAAQLLRGKTVFFDRDEVELEEGRVFIADLLGLPVFADGEKIGELKDVLTLPGNDVYVVRGAHEYMIPAVPEFVARADPEEGIFVHLIEGMRTDEN